MATDDEVRQLIAQIVSDQRMARQLMHGLVESIQSAATEQQLELTTEQARDVARSLIPKLAQLAWPDATSTSFEIPFQPPS